VSQNALLEARADSLAAPVYHDTKRLNHRTAIVVAVDDRANDSA
jgi:hypothetical protein